ncbi:MAG TPA: MBL fold metallo-hydrolase, partial [Burkholderiaceae bacterium]|nr:MBL fold metallo-hydrolase [Burkholderiaceae bacterium]
FDPGTSTITYVLFEREGGLCAVIDSVLDYDPKAGRTSTASADRVIAFVRAQRLTVDWLLETHAHADHLSAAPYLRQQLGGRIAIGEQIRTVQRTFRPIFNLEPEFRLDGSQFDYLFAPDEIFQIGNLRAQAWHVPGHTPADMAYRVESAGDDSDIVFVGDTLFMPDVGTARCDFPGGDAHHLYQSIQRLLSLPPDTRLMMCHDYPPAGREPAWETTVAAQRAGNIHVRDGISEADFVSMRERRDATLAMPTLILPAIQINIRAGDLPPPEANGTRYLKIPLDRL